MDDTKTDNVATNTQQGDANMSDSNLNNAWENTKEAGSDLWKATKMAPQMPEMLFLKISDAWEATKEVSDKAWKATKESAADAGEAISENQAMLGKQPKKEQPKPKTLFLKK